jgi:hypothetical protein
MKILLGIPIFILALAALFFMTMCFYAYRIYRKLTRGLRGEYTDEEVERFSNKYYRQKNTHHFSSDYFKSAGSSHSTAGQRSEEWNFGQSEQSANDRQRTTTSSGVTIIDDRDPNVASRKIFDNDEGEYVDFKEA